MNARSNQAVSLADSRSTTRDMYCPNAPSSSIEVLPSRLAQDYNAGRSTQLPAGIVLNIGKRRTARKLSFNGKAVQYERA